MTAMRNQRRWWLPLGFGLLVTLLLASLFQALRAQSAVKDAAENLTACRQSAERIRSLRTQPAQASLLARSSGEWARPIELAAKAAQLDPGQLLRIEPQPPRRLGQTVYQEQATHVELENASLKQVVVFLHAITAPKHGLGVKSLRLRAPQRAAAASPEVWVVELTLNSFVFDPKIPRPGA